MIDEPNLVSGWVDDPLRVEFPELALVYTEVEARLRRSPREIKARLRHASDRFTGSKAVVLRQQPIPWAYRVFFRHVGIDPDRDRTPIEAIALERMRAGGFRSVNLLEDALLLATLETSVPVQAFDSDAIEGTLGLRQAGDGERLGSESGRLIGRGRIVIADDRRAVGVLFQDTAGDVVVGDSTRRMTIAALKVKGVPEVSVEEALWTVTDTLMSTP